MTVAGQKFANRLLAPRAKQEVEAIILTATTIVMVNGGSLSKNKWKKTHDVSTSVPPTTVEYEIINGASYWCT